MGYFNMNSESQPQRGLRFVENGWMGLVRPRWGRRNTERMILQTYDLSEVNVFGPFDKMIFDEFCIIVLGRGVLLRWLWLCHAPFDPK